jgi:GcrA cell cycle regulator
MRYLAPMNHERGTGRRAFENRDWNESDVATLRAEWATGASTAEIGRRMGISKNAVIGKARRLRLPAREAPANIASPKSRGMVSRPAARNPQELPVFEARAASPSRSRAAIISGVSSAVERPSASPRVENLPEAVAETPPPRVFLGKKCCHPIGDRTCNEPVRANARGLKSPYCPEHFALIYAAPPAKSATNPPPATWLKNRGVIWARG